MISEPASRQRLHAQRKGYLRRQSIRRLPSRQIARRHAAIPKTTVYRPQEPRIEGWRHLAVGWAEITPDLQWEDDDQ